LGLIAACFALSIGLFRASHLDSLGFWLYQTISAVLTPSQTNWFDSGYEDSNIEMAIDLFILISVTIILYITANLAIQKLRNLR